MLSTGDTFIDEHHTVEDIGICLGEAFAKALGTGFRSPVRFQNIIVGHDDLGKPILEFDDELRSYLKEKNILSQHISISDEKNIATAFVVLET